MRMRCLCLRGRHVHLLAHLQCGSITVQCLGSWSSIICTGCPTGCRAIAFLSCFANGLLLGPPIWLGVYRLGTPSAASRIPRSKHLHRKEIYTDAGLDASHLQSQDAIAHQPESRSVVLIEPGTIHRLPTPRQVTRGRASQMSPNTDLRSSLMLPCAAHK